MTPSEACGSNCTWWTWRLIFEKPSTAFVSVISDVSVRRMQSPTLARMINGSKGIVPSSLPCFSSARAKIAPSAFGRPFFVFLIGVSMPTRLYGRVLTELGGQRPSARPVHGAALPSAGVVSPRSPSHGAPECPLPEKGGLTPTCVRSNGNAGLPLSGSNKILGRFPTKTSPRSPVGWPGMTFLLFGQGVVSSCSFRYRGFPGLVVSIFQSRTAASWVLFFLPCGGSCGRIQASRLSLVMTVPSGIVRPIRPAEATPAARAARSGSGIRSGWSVSYTRQNDHMPDR